MVDGEDQALDAEDECHDSGSKSGGLALWSGEGQDDAGVRAKSTTTPAQP